MKRTLRLGNTTLVVDHILAWRVGAYVGTGGNELPTTAIWMLDINVTFTLEGDHSEALAQAVEALHA